MQELFLFIFVHAKNNQSHQTQLTERLRLQSLRFLKTNKHMNIKSLIKEWITQSKEKGKCGNVFYQGKTIYSYGYHHKLATISIYNPKIAIVNTKWVSSSTARQLSHVRSALINNNFTMMDMNSGLDIT